MQEILCGYSDTNLYGHGAQTATPSFGGEILSPLLDSHVVSL